MTSSRDSKILEFRRAEEKPVVKRTLSHGDYEAEFFVDQKSSQPLYHYIITRRGAAEIVMWGQESSMSDAEHSALDRMYEMTRVGKAAAG